MRQQTKIMFTEERGATMYVVVRGSKMLNAIERHNLKKWGFITSDRREYALGIGRADSLPSMRGMRSMLATLRGLGFVEVDRAIASRIVAPKISPRLAEEEAARYSRMIENSFRLAY